MKSRLAAVQSPIASISLSQMPFGSARGSPAPHRPRRPGRHQQLHQLRLCSGPTSATLAIHAEGAAQAPRADGRRRTVDFARLGGEQRRQSSAQDVTAAQCAQHHRDHSNTVLTLHILTRKTSIFAPVKRDTLDTWVALEQIAMYSVVVVLSLRNKFSFVTLCLTVMSSEAAIDSKLHYHRRLFRALICLGYTLTNLLT